MRAVVGLGNPGPEHLATRHNLGFWVLERLLSRGKWRSQRFSWGQVYSGSAGLLLRPLTFMNQAGDAVSGFSRRWGISPQDLLVVYDDADLPLGEVRLRPAGGPGTHRGMASVLSALDTKGVPRLRVGIGQPPAGVDLVEYVLSPPSPQEAPALEGAVDWAAELAWTFLLHGLRPALDLFSQRSQP